jgi:hypothetical protein
MTTVVLVAIVSISLTLLLVVPMLKISHLNAEVFSNETSYSVEPDEGLLQGPSKRK